jgi:hypothetical protein
VGVGGSGVAVGAGVSVGGGSGVGVAVGGGGKVGVALGGATVSVGARVAVGERVMVGLAVRLAVGVGLGCQPRGKGITGVSLSLGLGCPGPGMTCPWLGGSKSVRVVKPKGQGSGPGQCGPPGNQPEWLRMVTVAVLR